jgi:hypothetical protein
MHAEHPLHGSRIHRRYPASAQDMLGHVHAVLACTNEAALETLVRVPSSPRVSDQCYEATYLQDAYRTVL